MRIFIILFLSLMTSVAHCATDALGNEVKINRQTPPEGHQLASIFLNNLGTKIENTGCASSAFDKDPRLLKDEFALALGQGLSGDSKYVTRVTGACMPDKYESNNEVIDGWHCNISFITEMKGKKKMEFVSSKIIDFGLTKDTWSLIPNSLICQ